MNCNTRLRKAMNKENPPPGSTPRFSLIRPLESYMKTVARAAIGGWLAGRLLPACDDIPFAIRAFFLAVHERVMRAKRIDAWTMPSGSPANRLR